MDRYEKFQDVKRVEFGDDDALQFTLDNIIEAHSKFTGVDFPKLIQEFKKMGMLTNSFNLQSGQVIYVHINGELIQVQRNAISAEINPITSSAGVA